MLSNDANDRKSFKDLFTELNKLKEIPDNFTYTKKNVFIL